MRVQNAFPQFLEASEAERHIHTVRFQNGGRLGNLGMEEFLNKVHEVKRKEEARKTVKRGEHLMCSICIEEMNKRDCSILDPCEHMFHKKCIDVSINLTSDYKL